MALAAGDSLVVGVCCPMGSRIRKGLTDFTVFYPAHGRLLRQLKWPPTGERNVYTNLVVSCYYHLSSILAQAVETEGGQAVRHCSPKQTTGRGGILSQNVITDCILFNGHDLPCIVPVKHLTFHP